MENAIFKLISQLDSSKIDKHRKGLLKPLQDYLSQKIKKKTEINLNFICTHNSRRSQLSQIWAKVIADFYGLNINSFSGGVEITACNERTIASLERLGFGVVNPGGGNPHYQVTYDKNKIPLVLFSKIYDDSPNPKTNFVTVMTCAHADENCPLITGSEKRISLPYEDPKAYDNSVEETKMYDEVSIQIATEMKYIFSGLME